MTKTIGDKDAFGAEGQLESSSNRRRMDVRPSAVGPLIAVVNMVGSIELGLIESIRRRRVSIITTKRNTISAIRVIPALAVIRSLPLLHHETLLGFVSTVHGLLFNDERANESHGGDNAGD